MHGNRIGQNHFIQFAKIIDNITVIKGSGYLAFLGPNSGDAADIAVKNIFVIVVADLHDLIIDTESAVPADKAPISGVHYGLKLMVEICGPNDPFVHRRQHLDIVYGIKAKSLGNPPVYKLQNNFQNFLWVILLNEIKIIIGIEYLRLTKGRQFTFIYLMRINNDTAGFGLAEYLIQLNNRKRAACDHIVKHIAGADRRQLIHITDKNTGGGCRNRF